VPELTDYIVEKLLPPGDPPNSYRKACRAISSTRAAGSRIRSRTPDISVAINSIRSLGAFSTPRSTSQLKEARKADETGGLSCIPFVVQREV
jgi:hypothetical protein